MKRWYFLPFSGIYFLVTTIRNLLYQIGIFKRHKFATPIINVGNLSVGGSGKSPMVMYLADELSKEYRTGILSRGYGRKTKGFLLTNYDSDTFSVGDEAMQLFNRFKNKFVIAVCEDRVFGAKKVIGEQELEVLILDDAYQHRAIQPGLNILMSDYADPYFKDFILPAGNLRESASGASRADVIVISKCPPLLTEDKKRYFIQKIHPKSNQKVFFSSIVYDEHIYNEEEQLPDNNLAYYDVLLVTGIANPKPLIERVRKFAKSMKHLKYPDHHHFSERDIEHILKKYHALGDYKILLTTEKDWVRLKRFPTLRKIMYYWPINVLIDREEEFNQIIHTYVRKSTIHR